MLLEYTQPQFIILIVVRYDEIGAFIIRKAAGCTRLPIIVRCPLPMPNIQPVILAACIVKNCRHTKRIYILGWEVDLFRYHQCIQQNTGTVGFCMDWTFSQRENYIFFHESNPFPKPLTNFGPLGQLRKIFL